MHLNNSFQYLNNIIRIFTHMYFKKIQTTLLKQYYQIGSYFLENINIEINKSYK